MNPVFSGIGNKQSTRMKVVRYTGSDTIKEGMLVAYDHDTTTNPTGGDAIAEGGQNPGKHYFVEKLSSDNYKAFAGVVATASYNGQKGPKEIAIYVPNGAVVPVLCKANISRDDAIYLVQDQYYAGTTPAAGQYIGRAFETVDRSSTEGLVLVQLDGNAAAITFIGNVTGNVTGDVTGNLTGDVTGDVTGSVTGNLTGDVIGDVTGNLAGEIDLTVNAGSISTGAPSAAELVAILGAPATAGRTRLVIGNAGTGAGEVFLCVDDGSAWNYVQLTASS